MEARTLLVLLTDEEAAACYGVSRRMFHELRKEPWMPKPVVLGPRTMRWSLAELEAAIANMPRQQEMGDQPRALARAHIERMKKGGGP